MSKTTKESHFAGLLKQAEEATNEIKDKELRTAAFQVILNHLLDGQTISSGTSDLPETKSPLKTSGLQSQKRAKSGPVAWLTELVEDDFFKQPKSLSQIIEELKNRSHNLKATDLTRPLQRLCHNRMLRRKKEAVSEGKKKVYFWSNW